MMPFSSLKVVIIYILPFQTNKTLTRLNLSWNGFGFEGCCAFGHSLHNNTTLKDLDLTCNRIHPPALYELMKGLLCNRGLVTLRVHCTKLDL